MKPPLSPRLNLVAHEQEEEETCPHICFNVQLHGSIGTDDCPCHGSESQQGLEEMTDVSPDKNGSTSIVGRFDTETAARIKTLRSGSDGAHFRW